MKQLSCTEAREILNSIRKRHYAVQKIKKYIKAIQKEIKELDN